MTLNMFRKAGQQLVQLLRWIRDRSVNNPLLFLSVIVLLGWFIWTIWTTNKADNLGFKKTLWDWMDLLIVPLILALGVYFLNYSQKKNEQEIAKENRHQTILENYFDRMTTLILDNGLGTDEENKGARSLARARTLTVLRSLDGERKGQVIQFLHESKLIGTDYVVDLDGADLRTMQLRWVQLDGIRLRGTNMRGADISGCFLLQESDLTGVDMSETKIIFTGLAGANLTNAKLKDADLTYARLMHANLEGSELDGAKLNKANLTHANLTKAKVTKDQLLEAMTLENATMPNGLKYEEWVEEQNDF